MSRPGRVLVLWLILVALGTLHPFVLDWRPVTVLSDSFFVPRLKGLDPPFNVLMFIPFGALVRRLGGTTMRATWLGFVVSATIELAQHYIAFRVPVFEDLVFNTLGAFVGARHLLPVERVARWVDRPRARQALFVTTTAFVVWSASPPIVEARLWRWATEATFVVGHEQPGNYAFRGTVHRATLFGADGRTLWSGDGDAPAQPDVAERVEADGAFAVEVDLTPAPGDALLRRVFVYSAGVQRRNFMVGARGTSLVFRVRTRVTPIVGLFVDGEEPMTIDLPERRSTVRFEYTTGVVRALVDGEVVRVKQLYLPPHNGVRTFWLPRGALGLWLHAFCTGLVVAAGAAGSWSRRTALLVALGVGLGLLVMQSLLFGGFAALTLVPLAFGSAIGAWSGR